MLATSLREWFAKEDSWCQNASARCNRGGHSFRTMLLYPDYVDQMCLNGAIHAVYGVTGWNGYFAPDVSQVIQRVREALQYQNHIDWNDAYERRIEDIRKLVNDLLI